MMSADKFHYLDITKQEQLWYTKVAHDPLYAKSRQEADEVKVEENYLSKREEEEGEESKGS